MTKYIGFLFLIILAFNRPSFGKNVSVSNKKEILLYDSTWSGFVMVDTSCLTKFKNDPAFFYFYKKSNFNNYLQILLYRISEFIRKLFSHKATPYFFYGIFGLLFLFLLLKLFDRKIQSFIIPPGNIRINDEINEINLNPEYYDQLIGKALNDHNFQIAVRYHFLKLLGLLCSKNIIDWKADKTNTEYVHEITNEELKSKFRELSGTYDYVWYGKFNVNTEMYSQINEKFDTFYKILK